MTYITGGKDLLTLKKILILRYTATIAFIFLKISELLNDKITSFS